MFPNLDLILLTLLHGSFVFFVLLIVIFILFAILLLAFSLAIFSAFLLDLHHFSSVLSGYLEIVKGDLQLGMVLILLSLIHQAVDFASVSKPPFHKRKFDHKFEVKAQQYSTSHIHVLKTIQYEQQPSIHVSLSPILPFESNTVNLKKKN